MSSNYNVMLPFIQILLLGLLKAIKRFDLLAERKIRTRFRAG